MINDKDTFFGGTKMEVDVNKFTFLQGNHENQEEIFDIGVDFAMLTLCQKLILSHGTFGIWAAILSQSNEVFYPEGYSKKPMEEILAIKRANLDGWRSWKVEPIK